MFWFPSPASDPKFIKLKKQFQELKILTSTNESPYHDAYGQRFCLQIDQNSINH